MCRTTQFSCCVCVPQRCSLCGRARVFLRQVAGRSSSTKSTRRVSQSDAGFPAAPVCSGLTSFWRGLWYLSFRPSATPSLTPYPPPHPVCCVHLPYGVGMIGLVHNTTEVVQSFFFCHLNLRFPLPTESMFAESSPSTFRVWFSDVSTVGSDFESVCEKHGSLATDALMSFFSNSDAVNLGTCRSARAL